MKFSSSGIPCRHNLQLVHCMHCEQPFLNCPECFPGVLICKWCERPRTLEPSRLKTDRNTTRRMEKRHQESLARMERAKRRIRNGSAGHKNAMMRARRARLKATNPEHYRKVYACAPSKYAWKRQKRKEDPGYEADVCRRYRDRHPGAASEACKRYREKHRQEILAARPERNRKRREEYAQRKAANAAS